MRSIISEDSLHPQIESDERFMLDTSKYIILSKMLENYLFTETVRVIFANSANNIKDKLEEDNNYISTIVYYDLVYDNPNTVTKLRDLLVYLINKECTNVFVVPIPCIEWQAIKAFGKDCELRDVAISFGDYKNTKIYLYNMNHKKATHEKYCKALLGEIVDTKFLGTCDIDKYNISTIEEFELIKTLPAFYSDKNNVGKINIVECLEIEYRKFISRFICSKVVKDSFTQTLAKYINLIKEN